MQTFDNGHFKRQEFIRCHTLCTAQDLIAQLLRLVKTDENGITAIIKVLKTNPTFLILDNFETLWDRDGENVAVLLSQIADISPSTILITTRTSTLPDHSDLVDYFTSILLRPIDQVASKKLFIKKAPRHADDADLGKLLELLDGYPLAISLVATRAAKMSSTLSSVINLWKKEVASYDSTLRSKEQSLEISLKLSIHGPIMESAPSALGLLSFIAHFPHGVYLNTLHKLENPPGIAKAVTALIDCSLADIVSAGTIERSRKCPDLQFELEENDYGFEQICLLVPVADFVRQHKEWRNEHFQQLVLSVANLHSRRAKTIFGSHLLVRESWERLLMDDAHHLFDGSLIVLQLFQSLEQISDLYDIHSFSSITRNLILGYPLLFRIHWKFHEAVNFFKKVTLAKLSSRS